MRLSIFFLPLLLIDGGCADRTETDNADKPIVFVTARAAPFPDPPRSHNASLEKSSGNGLSVRPSYRIAVLQNESQALPPRATNEFPHKRDDELKEFNTIKSDVERMKAAGIGTLVN